MEKIILLKQTEHHQNPDIDWRYCGVLSVPFFFMVCWHILQLSHECVLCVGNSVENVNQLVHSVWFCRLVK